MRAPVGRSHHQVRGERTAAALRALLGVVGLGGFLGLGAAACVPRLPPDPRPLFARRVGVPVPAVRGLQSWEIESRLPLLVGLYEARGGRRAALLPVLSVRGGHRFGSPVLLGRADRIWPLEIVDLQGPAVQLAYRPEGVSGELRLPESTRQPAVLARSLVVADGGRLTSARLLLVRLRPRPKVIWEEEVERHDARGAGFRPVRGLRLRPGPGTLLDLELEQVRLGSGGRPRGGVRIRRFRFRNGRYRRLVRGRGARRW